MGIMGRPILNGEDVENAIDLLQVRKWSRRKIARYVGLSNGLLDILAKELSTSRCPHNSIAKRCKMCTKEDAQFQELCTTKDSAFAMRAAKAESLVVQSS